MTNQREAAAERDELELEPEQVKDLDLDEERSDDVRGGQSYGASSPAPTR